MLFEQKINCKGNLSSQCKQEQKLTFKTYSVYLYCCFSLFALPAAANSIAINHSQLEQVLSVQDSELTLTPAGQGISVSFDLTSALSMQVNYQSWQDNNTTLQPRKVAIDLTTWGGSLVYNHNDWAFSAYVSNSTDQAKYHNTNKRQSLYRLNESDTKTFGAAVAYNFFRGSWLYDISLALDYNDWQSEQWQKLPMVIEGEPQLANESTIQTNNHNLNISSSFSMAHYWSLNDNNSVLLGTSLAWYYQLSGQHSDGSENLIQRPNRRQLRASRTTNTIGNLAGVGDESYGQLSLYLVYELNDAWSIDADISQEIASYDNNQSWSLGLSYAF